MGSFREKLARFMYGRYGFDRLGRFLFLLSFVFWALCLILRFTPLFRIYYLFSAINTALYVIAIFRILSRNTYKRALENERYCQLVSRLYPKFKRGRERYADREYVFRDCPNCRSRLRLKRVRGRHTTRCPRCGKTFKVRVLWGSSGT